MEECAFEVEIAVLEGVEGFVQSGVCVICGGCECKDSVVGGAGEGIAVRVWSLLCSIACEASGDTTIVFEFDEH